MNSETWFQEMIYIPKIPIHSCLKFICTLPLREELSAITFVVIIIKSVGESSRRIYLWCRPFRTRPRLKRLFGGIHLGRRPGIAALPSFLSSRIYRLLARRRSLGRRIRLLALICSLRRLHSSVLILMPVVTFIGVEGRAGVLRLLLLSVRRRRRGRRVSSVRGLLLELLGVLIVALLVVVVHLMVVGLIAVFPWSHPPGSVNRLSAASATSARDHSAQALLVCVSQQDRGSRYLQAGEEDKKEETGGDGGDYPAAPIVPVTAVAAAIVVAFAGATDIVARDETDKMLDGRHCLFWWGETQRRLPDGRSIFEFGGLFLLMTEGKLSQSFLR